MKEIIVYSDGSCLGNPGPGGWAAILISGTHRKELSAGYRLTTNNRMEILAAISALEAIKSKSNVTIYTDSRLIVDTIGKWLANWKKNGWKKADKKSVLNIDLWQRLDLAMAKHNVTFNWVKGHAGNTENENCDILCKAAASSDNLLIDEIYEDSNAQPIMETNASKAIIELNGENMIIKKEGNTILLNKNEQLELLNLMKKKE